MSIALKENIDPVEERNFLEELLDINPDELINDEAALFRRAVMELSKNGAPAVGDRAGDYIVHSIQYVPSQYSHRECPHCNGLNAYYLRDESGGSVVHVCAWCEEEFRV